MPSNLRLKCLIDDVILLSNKALLFTEWFDIDEPCLTGDTEDVVQNLAYVSNFQKTAPHRICPKILRRGNAQFQTTQGHEIPDNQVLHLDYKNDKLVCLNSEQSAKAPPPDYWYHKKIKCVDYKIRHQCECLFGCLTQIPPKITNSGWISREEEVEEKQENQIKIVLPKVETLFDECEWMPFVDTTTPDNGTWDAEVRGSIIRQNKALIKHVCNDNLVDAMYIDTRRVEDDVPWHETGEIMTKNTPM